MLAAVTGVCFGLAQLVVLRALIKSLLAGDSIRVAAFVFLKFLVWGGFFAVAALLFRTSILPIGTAAATTLVLGGFFWFLLAQRKQKTKTEEAGA